MIREVSPSVIKTAKVTHSLMTSHDPVTLKVQTDPVTMSSSFRTCIEIYIEGWGKRANGDPLFILDVFNCVTYTLGCNYQSLNFIGTKR